MSKRSLKFECQNQVAQNRAKSFSRRQMKPHWMPAASEQLLFKSVFTVIERFGERNLTKDKRNANEPSLS